MHCSIQHHIGIFAIAKPCVIDSCTRWDNANVTKKVKKENKGKKEEKGGCKVGAV